MFKKLKEEPSFAYRKIIFNSSGKILYATLSPDDFTKLNDDVIKNKGQALLPSSVPTVSTYDAEDLSFIGPFGLQDSMYDMAISPDDCNISIIAPFDLGDQESSACWLYSIGNRLEADDKKSRIVRTITVNESSDDSDDQLEQGENLSDEPDDPSEEVEEEPDEMTDEDDVRNFH